MKLKTLESSIADRLNELTPMKQADHGALINHLTILDRADTVQFDHSLVTAVGTALTTFGLDANTSDDGILGRRVAAKLAALNDPRSRLRALN